MLRPAIAETVAALHRVLRLGAPTPAQLAAIVLVGGSSRIPLVSELLSAEFGRPLALDTHPKHDVALGAALRSAPVPAGAAQPRAPVVPAPVVPVPAPQPTAQPAPQPLDLAGGEPGAGGRVAPVSRTRGRSRPRRRPTRPPRRRPNRARAGRRRPRGVFPARPATPSSRGGLGTLDGDLAEGAGLPARRFRRRPGRTRLAAAGAAGLAPAPSSPRCSSRTRGRATTTAGRRPRPARLRPCR
jgi:hypothetical protein